MERLRTRFPHTLVLAFEPAGRGRATTAPGAGRAAAATTRSPSTSSPTCAGAPASEAESAAPARGRATRAATTRSVDVLVGSGAPADEAAPPRDHARSARSPTPVRVDFDALSEAGLFLLTGATGAGKTSVLDAVCFALYGDVPGDRSSAKRLRSDQAAPGVAPEVILEATLAGRRIRITRSPSWERPKHRGAGLTTQQASRGRRRARRRGLADALDAGWTRAGYLVGELVGLNLDQFCQVAMLPQGRFQAFLRARSEDRHKLLQQLFRTGRFEGVERWLRDHRLALRRSSEHARGHRVGPGRAGSSEAAAPSRPADDPPGLEDAAGGRPLERVGGHAGGRRRRGSGDRAAARARGGDLGGGHRRSGAARPDSCSPTDRPAMPPRAASCPGSTGRSRATSAPPACSTPRPRATRALPAVERAEAARDRRRSRRRAHGGGRRSRPRRTAASPWTPTSPATRDDALARALPRPRPCCPGSERLVGLRRQVATYAARIAAARQRAGRRRDRALARLPERLERCRADRRGGRRGGGGAARRRVGAATDLRKRVVRRGPARRAPAPSWPRPAPPSRRRSTRCSS